ncbi:DUF4142 domain-containing protein [Pseudonocardia sp. K10HN5]|uniref:DUF4142 domain-containing protein n=1 Tax=Pseudonocardia acidicola TaxID=2724939 RepID=A0ABX1SEA7_9PSEU|nr:DUF4142 domain-containing protein [Pseudonocardia acidicola]
MPAQRGTTAAIKQTAQTPVSDHQQALQQLTGATGTAFDLAYLQPEISGHQESISGNSASHRAGWPPAPCSSPGPEPDC